MTPSPETATREPRAAWHPEAPPSGPAPPPDRPFNWPAALAFLLGPAAILLILAGAGSTFYAALPIAIAAIVFGSIGKRAADRGDRRGPRGLAVAGQVFGIIGTIVAAIAIVALLIVNAALDAGAESLSGLIDQVRAELEGISLPEQIPSPEGLEAPGGEEPPEEPAPEPGAEEPAAE